MRVGPLRRVVDGIKFIAGSDYVGLGDLSDNVRIKRSWPLMHLKAYTFDGTVLRAGSANFSASGERARDDNLIMI